MLHVNLASSCVIDFIIESGQILRRDINRRWPARAGATVPTASFESRTPFGRAAKAGHLQYPVRTSFWPWMSF